MAQEEEEEDMNIQEYDVESIHDFESPEMVPYKSRKRSRQASRIPEGLFDESPVIDEYSVRLRQ